MKVMGSWSVKASCSATRVRLTAFSSIAHTAATTTTTTGRPVGGSGSRR